MLGLKKNLVPTFEYLYMIVMVAYMGQMDFATSRMVKFLTGDPVSLFLPIVMTVILISRNKVSFASRELRVLLAISIVWSVAVIVKMHLYSIGELSYYFFFFYSIIIAYIHTRVYKNKYFEVFEEVMVFFCKCAFVLWLFSVLLPGVAASIFHQFPVTSYGNNFLYLFDWMDPAKEQMNLGMIRNAGNSWEPGRFAVMICLALAVNLSRVGISFRGNKNVIWLLLALASTMSTTGYGIAMVLYTLFWMKNFNVRSVISYAIIIVPIFYGMMSLDFLGDKLKGRMDVRGLAEDKMIAIDWANSQGDGDEWMVALDRPESMFFESVYNIPHDPLLGYGRNTLHSYYSENISKAFSLTGGLLKLVGQMGIPFAIFLYYILYKSSVAISLMSNEKRKLAIFLVIIMASVSYDIFVVPIFTGFWLYGLFSKDFLNNWTPNEN